MSIEFEQWKKKYHGKRIVNFSNFLSHDDIELLKKLEIVVDLSKIYTEYEYDILEMDLIAYYDEAEDIDGNKLPAERKLEDYNVSKEDYERILETFYNIGLEYNF